MSVLRYHIKKNNYKIIVFQFTVRIDTVYKRNIQRSEAKLEKYIKKKRIEELEKMHDERFDKNAFLIDTNKLGKTQVIKFILKKLGLK